MSESISLIIDGTTISVPSGTTILKAAETIGRTIPTICFHDHCTANALCRTCVVEVQGTRPLVASCTARVADGMVVLTRSPRVERSRRTILEMLASSVDLSESPQIQDMINDYAALPGRFTDSEVRQAPVIDDNPMYIRDYSKCVLCWRCVQVCAEDAQYTFAINFSGRGYETQIATFFDRSMPQTTCVFCGQCVGVCPTGALKPKREWLLEQGMIPEQVIHATRSEKKRKKSHASS
jgi:NADP-reducing hydrogenase subunit HndD